jgi:hypothetical protein
VGCLVLLLKENIMRNINKYKKLRGSIYDLCPQHKAQMTTFCSYFFEWCLQYNMLLFIGKLDHTNRLQL